MSREHNFWIEPATIDQYFKKVRISTEDVHYAYNFPGEKELNLLGKVQGKRAIEIGCGRGENSIALAKMGAHVLGIDMSAEMLNRARHKALVNGVEIKFIQMRAENLGTLKGEFDIAVSAYVFDYIKDIRVVFQGVGHVLVQGGIFVFSFCHPAQRPAESLRVNGSYYVEGEWPGTGVIVRNYFHPIDSVERCLSRAGFKVEKMIEVNTPADISPREINTFPYRIPIDQGFNAPLNLPHTIIFKAKRQ